MSKEEDKMPYDAKKVIYDRAMGEIQKEWEKNSLLHRTTHIKTKGIRSSQISALVMFLVKIKVIKIEDVSEVL